MSESYDIVIVGGGTAGLVLAARLSENADVQVVVVEAGEDQSANEQALTPGMWPHLAGSAADWAFSTTPQQSFGGLEHEVPQGHALGGSSTINSFLFLPTSEASVEAWAGLGNEGWDWPAFEEATRKVYTLHKADGTVTGDGPLQLNVSDPETEWVKAWTDSLSSLGFPLSDPFSGHVSGSVIIPESIDPAKKQRSSSASAYLAGARGRPNLTVLTGTSVTKVLLDKSNPDNVIAEGVQVVKGGETKTIKARKEVILAAGPINSPRLLELSGIGGTKLLQGLGIDVAVDNPHVGENLQNHLSIVVTFPVRDDLQTLDPLLRRDPTAMAACVEAYSKGTGPLSTSNSVGSAQLPLPEADGKELVDLLGSLKAPDDSGITPAFAAAHEAFVRSVLSDPKQASAVYITGAAYSNPVDRTVRPPGNHFSTAMLLAHPLSRGSVHISNASPENASGNTGVVIDPRYMSHPLDAEVLARHILFLEKHISHAEPLASRFKPREPRFPDLEAARAYVRQASRAAQHYTGTCAMMSQELGGVVDSRLRVYGCANLRVCDSSVVPIQPRANAQATVYGVAEMGAKFIQESL